MRTLNAVFGKKVTVDAFNLFGEHNLSRTEMNYIRGGGDPPQDDDPIDVIFPYPPRP